MSQKVNFLSISLQNGTEAHLRTDKPYILDGNEETSLPYESAIKMGQTPKAMSVDVILMLESHFGLDGKSNYYKFFKSSFIGIKYIS